MPIGEALFGGNTVGIYLLLYVLAWRFRDHTWIGWLIAIMAADKLAAIAMAGWLVATGRYRTVAVIAVGLLLAFVVGGVGAGFDAYVQWLEVLGTVGVSPLGLSGITGISWASYAALAGGIVIALALGGRSPRASYAVPLTASVLAIRRSIPVIWRRSSPLHRCSRFAQTEHLLGAGCKDIEADSGTDSLALSVTLTLDSL